MRYTVTKYTRQHRAKTNNWGKRHSDKLIRCTFQYTRTAFARALVYTETSWTAFSIVVSRKTIHYPSLCHVVVCMKAIPLRFHPIPPLLCVSHFITESILTWWLMTTLYIPPCLCFLHCSRPSHSQFPNSRSPCNANVPFEFYFHTFIMLNFTQINII